jgi:hypothetical protein
LGNAPLPLEVTAAPCQVAPDCESSEKTGCDIYVVSRDAERTPCDDDAIHSEKRGTKRAPKKTPAYRKRSGMVRKGQLEWRNAKQLLRKIALTEKPNSIVLADITQSR